MKGLLLKDLLVFFSDKVYRIFILILSFCLVGCMVMGSDIETSITFIVLACVLFGTLPISLLGMDENSKWLNYALALPYAKKDLVISKYLLLLCITGGLLVLLGGGFGISLVIHHNFNLNDYLMILTIIIIVSQLITILSFPFYFKLGVERGRMAYYGVLVLFMVFISIFADVYFYSYPTWSLIIILLIIPILFIVSLKVSIIFFEQREL